MGAVLVAMGDDRGAGVRAHACLGERQRRRAECALGRHPANQPVSPTAAGAMIDLMLAIHDVITATSGIVRHAQVAESRDGGHIKFLSDTLNGPTDKRLHRLNFLTALERAQSLCGTGVQCGLRREKSRPYR